MKRFIILFSVFFSLALFSSTSIKGQSVHFQYNVAINDYWGQWQDAVIGVGLGIQHFYVNGDYDNFVIHSDNEHPSRYIMKVVVNNFKIDTDKKSKKQRIKYNMWYEYSGTVEYYTELTFEDFGKYALRWPFIRWNTSNGKKHVVNAKIKIAPYKDLPAVYNIHFEDYGVAISPKGKL